MNIDVIAVVQRPQMQPTNEGNNSEGNNSRTRNAIQSTKQATTWINCTEGAEAYIWPKSLVASAVVVLLSVRSRCVICAPCWWSTTQCPWCGCGATRALFVDLVLYCTCPFGRFTLHLFSTQEEGYTTQLLKTVPKSK